LNPIEEMLFDHCVYHSIWGLSLTTNPRKMWPWSSLSCAVMSRTLSSLSVWQELGYHSHAAIQAS
jgi:hypothetical protein